MNKTINLIWCSQSNFLKKKLRICFDTCVVYTEPNVNLGKAPNMMFFSSIDQLKSQLSRIPFDLRVPSRSTCFYLGLLLAGAPKERQACY